MKVSPSIVVALLLSSAVFAEDQANLATVFPHEAAISCSDRGLSRVEIPVEVLTQCQADLADLRLFASDGREVPYLVESFGDSTTAREVKSRVQASIEKVDRQEQRSDNHPPHFIERYTLGVPESGAESDSLILVFESSRREFVSSIRLTGIRNDGSETQILEHASLHRLQSPHSERLEFPILEQGLRSLSVELQSEGQRFLQPSMFFETRDTLLEPGSRAVPLNIVSVRESRGQTSLLVKRPRGLVPDRLILGTRTGAFKREVVVWDEGPSATDTPLGSKTVYRIDAIAPIDQLEVPVTRAQGDHLRIVIDDHDSPPLDKITVSALIQRPVLFFSVPSSDFGATLLFGGGRARRPDYDLASFEPPSQATVTGETAKLALPFWDIDRAQTCTLSGIDANPLYNPKPVLSFAMHPGAELDTGPFALRSRLQVKPSPEGLARLRLGPEILALARPDLNDIRIVDEQDRQWAYLLDRESGTSRVNLDLIEHTTSEGQSRYQLELPSSPMAIQRLEFDPEARFYDRAFRLEGNTENGTAIVLAQGRIRRHLGDPRAASFSCSPVRVTDLVLTIDDGDDAPLGLGPVYARTPHSDLYLTAPEGVYDLLFAYPDARAPRYELERVRNTVLGVPAFGVEASPVEENPAYSARARLASSAGAQRLILWIVIAVAVVVLTALTFRLARSE